MPLFTFEGRSPTVDPGAFIAPTATLVGAARGSDASVAGGGVRTSQTAPAHTTTVATDAAIRRPIPNQSTHARAR